MASTTSLSAFDRPSAIASNTVFKSGPLFISSKGLGWKSWKKRWFILTRSSLVFFKNDPSILPQRSREVNLTLGGIDLNNSGSVVVREDKKLLTVLFPDGRDGRAFTLKAETSEDLHEWKIALESALSEAPNPVLVMGHSGLFRAETNDTIDASYHQWRDKRPAKSLVVGRPILLALEDLDGGPSFLEKALRFLETRGTRVEGILRESADVEEVDQRVQDYELGKNEFEPYEDAHVIGDCVKYVLRELPSSPVPASCCTALLEAYRNDGKDAQINAIRGAVMETFPEPNRRLLQRILKMMRIVSSNAKVNRMSPSAVAACMAPLLLRPLLAGECEQDYDYDTNDDDSAQLLAAATAANNAQAIITMLLEEYESIFDDETLQRCSISVDSRVGNSGTEDSTDDETLNVKENGFYEGEKYETLCYKAVGDESGVGSPPENRAPDESPSLNAEPAMKRGYSNFLEQTNKQKKGIGNLISESNRSVGASVINRGGKRVTVWGRNNAIETWSMESVDSSGEEELAIQRLEITKNELKHRIAKEARGNAILQASLERRKQALHERRLALEQDVSRLQGQLQTERDLTANMEVGFSMSSGQFPCSRGSKTRAELEEIALAEADVARLKQKVAELHHLLHQQRQHHYGSISDSCDHCSNLKAHQKSQPEFDDTAFADHERSQRVEENLAVSDWRNIKRHEGLTVGGKQPNGKHQMESSSVSDSKSTRASATLSMDELCCVDSALSTSRLANMEYPRHAFPSATSSALVELTTRLDFFKERRSHLMEQLHNLDLNYGDASQDLMCRPKSPPWK